MAQHVVNIKDVARRAGVSVGTVSLALNNRPGVAAKTREQVFRVIEELGYVPNLIGRAINRRSCGALGIVVPIANSVLFSHVVAGVNECAEEYNLPIFVSFSRDQTTTEARMLKMFSHLRVDGIVLAATPNETNLNLLKMMAERGTAIVQVERYVESVPGDFVGSDNYGQTFAETTRLIEAGHQRIAAVFSSLPYSTSEERRAGFEAAMRQAGRTIDDDLVLSFPIVDEAEADTATIERLLTEGDRPTALLWCTGKTIWLAGVLNRLSWQAGREVEITVFDGDPLAEYLGQPFHTLFQDGMSIGMEATSLLLERIEQQNKAENANSEEEPAEPRQIRLPYKAIHSSATAFGS
jgi:DNA-binding LacI/PurR family transcriptional regulator